MDDTTRMWMYFSWLEDISEHNITLRNQGCLIGSFWNPEAAREMMGEGVQKVATDDKEFDKATEYVLNYDKEQKAKKASSRRKRKIKTKIKEDEEIS